MRVLEEAIKRLVSDVWDAARDPRTAKEAGALDRWRAYGVQKVQRLIEERTHPLIGVASALARSEVGVMSGRPDDFEPWPEMDALVAELDRCAPGWRNPT